MNNKLKGPPPSNPRPLLHLILDPLKHMLIEFTDQNCGQEWRKAKTSEKDFSHLEAKLADRRLTKCEAACCSKPSTDKTKGVKFPLLSSTAEQ